MKPGDTRDVADTALGPALAVTRAAVVRPDGIAMTFVDYSTDRGGLETSLTYRDLAERSAAVAAGLLENTDPGGRAAILCGHGVDYVAAFLGCLRAGVIGVPLFAPEPFRSADRLLDVIADCTPEIVLTSGKHADAVQELLASPRLSTLPKEVMLVDETTPDARTALPGPPGGDAVAYLQYTSGSTRAPAGVQVTHRNLVAGAAQLAGWVPADESSSLVSWLPFFHDMGLMFSVVLPLASMIPVTCLAPLAFIQQPRRWLELLTTHRATGTMSPNFGLDLCVDRVGPHQRAGIDLSALRTLGNGSEQVRPKTLSRFTEAFQDYGFRHEAHCPGYGLAEATLVVTGHDPGQPPHIGAFDRQELSAGRIRPVNVTDPRAQLIVSSGRPIRQEVRIVHPQTGAETDAVGEIRVRGNNVCAGYWRQPERSAETFGAGNAEEAGWLRTGDLGFLRDGRLYVTGRLRDLIIIDGRNHQPADIEATVEEACPQLRQGRVVAFASEIDDAEHLVVVAELLSPTSTVDVGAIRAAVRASVSERHGVRVHIVALVRKGMVPITSSGKLRRQEARTRFEGGGFERG
ncbi:fatty acyl-AMP ligase [Kutzneria buriramensis]|uniref:Acyl-CoA synthetase (AMP-forming)/AMP-acid ligase II n=1 Tax=Kutzneria buriramensis TaxID=1045776 RepID=A0A3E0GUN2_9PSEU|nr:fatty acyl-AMP ligase [Kutzneria buriramensis]REH27639.1 acyl-CoA synthetase (AMP-forming)/AMP-acid ligase II [Kutzneria buriramensis]